MAKSKIAKTEIATIVCPPFTKEEKTAVVSGLFRTATGALADRLLAEVLPLLPSRVPVGHTYRAEVLVNDGSDKMANFYSSWDVWRVRVCRESVREDQTSYEDLVASLTFTRFSPNHATYSTSMTPAFVVYRGVHGYGSRMRRSFVYEVDGWPDSSSELYTRINPKGGTYTLRANLDGLTARWKSVVSEELAADLAKLELARERSNARTHERQFAGQILDEVRAYMEEGSDHLQPLLLITPQRVGDTDTYRFNAKVRDLHTALTLGAEGVFPNAVISEALIHDLTPSGVRTLIDGLRGSRWPRARRAEDRDEVETEA